MVATAGEPQSERAVDRDVAGTSDTEHRGLADVLPFPAARPQVGEPPLRDVIGTVLREERLEQERTLADVARDAAVSLPYLSEVERGRKDVSSDVLAAIGDALELPLAEILERSAVRIRTTGFGGAGIQMLAA